MRARIYRRPKNAMQSGAAQTQEWVLEYEPSGPVPDPIMGWSGGSSTLNQVTLLFPAEAEAKAYADRKGILYDLGLPPPERPLKPRAYADNFRYGRMENWTH